jgi:hypothetical protein
MHLASPRRILPAGHQAADRRCCGCYRRQAAQQRRPAAAVGAVRGDLWAESAFTFADLLWGNAGDNPEPRVFQEALARLDHAIDDAPHQSSAWLLLAGLAARHPMPNLDPVEALKMSYYTGASEQELMPLRLHRAAIQSVR